MPIASLSILLYLSYALVKLLLANAMGWNMLLSGTVSFWHIIPSHVCQGAAPRPSLDAS